MLYDLWRYFSVHAKEAPYRSTNEYAPNGFATGIELHKRKMIRHSGSGKGGISVFVTVCVYIFIYIISYNVYITINKTKDDIKLSLSVLFFRMNDKIQRIKQLVVLGAKDNVGEAIDDTYQDLSVYGVIAQLVSRGKWAK